MSTNGELEFYAKGTAFNDGQYDLRSAERLLTNYRRLVDVMLPLALSQKTLTKRLQEEVKYKVSFKQGSWVTTLQFVLEHKEIFAAIAASDNANYFLSEHIAKLIEGSLDLWRKFDEILAKGEKPRIQIASDNHQNSDLNIGDISGVNGSIIIINQPIQIIAAQLSKPVLDSLVKSVDGNVIESLSINSANRKTIITADDKRITGSLKEELAQNIEIIGRLDMVAFSAHKGNLLTGNGRHPVTWDEDIRNEIRNHADIEDMAFTVKPVIDNKRIGDEPIGFHILRVRNPQSDLWQKNQ